VIMAETKKAEKKIERNEAKKKEVKHVKKEAKSEKKKPQKKKEEKKKIIKKRPVPPMPEGIDPYEILKYVHMSEKSVRNIEKQNSLVFIVNRKFNKNEVRSAVTNAFGKDVGKVSILIDQKGRKKAFVKFTEEGAAGDIAVRLGII